MIEIRITAETAQDAYRQMEDIIWQGAIPTPTEAIHTAPINLVTATSAPATAAPVAVSAPAPVAVPTSAPTYNIDQIMTAGAGLAQSGKTPQLLDLLAKYGVQAVPQLKPEQLGSFATELRGLGAQI